MSSVESASYFVPGLHEAMPQTKEISIAAGEESLFDQVLDMVNPLQHLPVVSTVYRAITGDEISGPARLVGGALFGGPVGFASAAANMVLEQATGGDLGDHAMAFIGATEDTPQVAAAPAADPRAGGVQLAAATPQAADNGSDIIWNGPRVLPSLASATAPVTDTAPPATQSAPPQISANQPPAWLAAAIADAETVQEAAQQGATSRKVDAQPWITDAMLEALSKYESLARERNR